MQAVRIHEHGGPDVLRVEEIPDAEVGPGLVLCRVLGVSVNHLDLWVRRGMPGFPVAFPRILGCDAAGEVVEVGEGVEGFATGDRVILEPGFSAGDSEWDLRGDDHLAPDYGIRGEHCDGFDCELVALEPRFLTKLPDGVEPVEAAAVPLVFVTAHGMLVERARVREGETVLVLGGASGVGSAAIQIAKAYGARVLATAGSDAKRELCLRLGADEALDHGHEGWPDEVRRLTDGAGCDVVVEHVGPATWAGSMKALARLGRLVTCGGTTGPKVQVLLPHLFIKNQSILGSTMGPRRAFGEIFERVANGAYRPVVGARMPLSEVVRAHEALEGREILGKVVLIPGA